MKHLQADLSSVFVYSPPKYEAPPLPSGSVYHSRMPLSYAQSSMPYYEVRLTDDNPITIRYQAPRSFPVLASPVVRLSFHPRSTFGFTVHDEYFRSYSFYTFSDALIFLYLNRPNVALFQYPSELSALQETNPEYFI